MELSLANFDAITKIIDDIVAFIKSATANLKKFIAGLGKDYELNMPEEE